MTIPTNPIKEGIITAKARCLYLSVKRPHVTMAKQAIK
jgi:hypothetical protein